MPIYEYTCDACRKRFSALVGVLAGARPASCPRCGSSALTKMVSRFARVRSEDEALESLADESAIGDIENDPKAMRKWVREMGKAMDEDMGDELEEALDEEMQGEGEGGEGRSEPTDDTIY